MNRFAWLAITLLSLSAACDAEDVAPDETPVAESASVRALSSSTQLDPTFGSGGRVYVRTGVSWPENPTAIADAGGGKITFVGTNISSDPSSFPMAVVGRVHADGSEDSDSWTWNTWAPGYDRILNIDVGGAAHAYDVIVGAAGSEYVVGSVENNSGKKGYLVRLDVHGQMVTTFGNHGVVGFAPTGFKDVTLYQIERDGMGRLVVAGHGFRTTDAHDQAPVLFVARYDAHTGALDNTFSGNGWLSWADDGPYDGAPKLAIGKGRVEIVIGSVERSKVLRFNADGSFDSAFGSPVAVGLLSDVAVAPNGMVYALVNGCGVWAFKAAGGLETRFGHDGEALVPSSSGAFDNPYCSRLVYSNELDRLYMVGTGYPVDGNHGVMITAAMRPDGLMDTTFTGDGKTTVTFPGATSQQGDAIASMDEKIVIAGKTSGDMAMARFAPRVAGEGAPCHYNNQCASGFTCKREAPKGIPVEVCRPIPVAPPPTGGTGQRCLSSVPWCNDPADTCDTSNYRCRVRQLFDECAMGDCPEDSVCYRWGYGATACLPVSEGSGSMVYVVARGDSCTNVSSTGFCANGAGATYQEAKENAAYWLSQQVCEGTNSGCCEYEYEVTDGPTICTPH